MLPESPESDRARRLAQAVDFTIITALPKEFAAAEAMLEGPVVYFADGRGAGRRYTLGEIPTANGGTHVIAIAMADQGNDSAASRATLVLQHFQTIQGVLMVGIAGGVPNPAKPSDHVRLGDIVVSGEMGVVKYTFVKEHWDREEPRWPPRPPGAELYESARQLEVSELQGRRPWEPFFQRASSLPYSTRPNAFTDKLAHSTEKDKWIDHPGDPQRRDGFPKVFRGTIACADVLLKNPEKRDMLRDAHSAKAVEMETSGIAQAAWNHSVGYITIRGICDYCDKNKGDEWQGYASVVAAAYARALLEGMPSSSRRGGAAEGEAKSRSSTAEVSLPEGKATSDSTSSAEIVPALRPSRWKRNVPRLEGTASEVRRAISASAGVIAVRGNAGDGKSEVARQIAGTNDGLYLELPAATGELKPNDIWRIGLSRLIEELTKENVREEPLDAIWRRAKHALAAMAPNRVLVIDNADVDAPCPVAELLDDRAQIACVVIGHGVKTVDREIFLPAPTPEEFLAIAQEGGPETLPGREREFLLAIGARTNYCALVAKGTRWLCGTHERERRLEDFREALGEDGLDNVDEQMHRPLRKLWSSLTEDDRTRVAIVAAFGLPEIPVEWMPEHLRRNPASWKLLDDAGAIERVESKHVRIHRLIAQWVRGVSQPSVVSHVAQTVGSWSRASVAFDALKADSIHTRAIVQAYRYMRPLPEFERLDPELLAILAKSYIDCAPPTDDHEALERHLRLVVDDQAQVEALPLIAAGEVADLLRRTFPPKNGYLYVLRDAASKRLTSAVTASLPPVADDDATRNEVGGLYHAAKSVLKSSKNPGERSAAQALLSQIVAHCNETIRIAHSPVHWMACRTLSTVQLVGHATELGPETRAQMALDALDSIEAELPAYLRLALIQRLLSVPSVPDAVVSIDRRVALVRQGLALCREDALPTVQADFVRDAAGQIERTGVWDVYDEVRLAARSIESRVTDSPRTYAECARGLAHAFHKLGAAGSTSDDFEDIVRAFGIYSRQVKRYDTYLFTRLAAVIRDLGDPSKAEQIAQAVLEVERRIDPKSRNVMFALMERIKAQRWIGLYSEAIEAGFGFANSLGDESRQSGLLDETAKSCALDDQRELAAATLESNAEDYEALGLTYFSQRCRGWAASMRTNQKDPSLVEDQFLCSTRRESVDATRLREVGEQIDRVYEDLLKRCAERSQPKPRPGNS